MRILVTGNRGFVGAETCRLLKDRGHEVIGYDLMDGFDIRDKKQLAKACFVPVFNVVERPSTPERGRGQFSIPAGERKVDRILHLAAIARFSDADANPRLAFETNVLGTKNVAEVAARYHIPLVYASTGSVYMPISETPETGIHEGMPAKGNSVYGVTKYLGETYVREHTPYIILRYAHLYGREKRGHGLVGGFADRIARGLQPKLYGGNQSNDFTYVKDVAQANLLAVEASWDKWNQVYNVGTGEELTARRAGELVCEVASYRGGIEVKDQREVDASRFVYDTSKAERMLGFKAQYSFEDGLKDMFKEDE